MTCRRPTIVEVLVIVAVAATIVGLLLPDSATQTRREIERRIETWHPGPGDSRLPPKTVLRPEMDIAGEWLVERHRSSTRLAVSRNAAGDYVVQFQTKGCLGGYADTRQGVFRDATLVLDKPVSEYTGSTYDRLFAIEVEGVPYLIPAAAVEEYDKSFPKDTVFRHAKAPESIPNNQ